MLTKRAALVVFNLLWDAQALPRHASILRFAIVSPTSFLRAKVCVVTRQV